MNSIDEMRLRMMNSDLKKGLTHPETIQIFQELEKLNSNLKLPKLELLPFLDIKESKGATDFTKSMAPLYFSFTLKDLVLLMCYLLIL